ncbi:hypothetical protein, partial [Salinivibrio kushneri]|uniref:hypothetical protein n=1 Tax=Salinivibrio kushneri TaxID=1908198 RepID=UPI00098893EC
MSISSMFFENFRSLSYVIKSWVLTSDFMTYQSPARLMALMDRMQGDKNLCSDINGVGIGDTVYLVDTLNLHPFRFTIVPTHRFDRSVGYITIESYLG